MSPAEDFFRSRIDQMIDLRHPLAVLASRMPWQEIEASLAHQFARQVKAGKKVEDIGLFGPEVKVVGGGRSNAGRPRLPIRLMVSLLHLKHAFNESDEGVVERWAETPTWQYFSGMDYFEHRLPCDATLVGKFRKLISTVQPKAIAYPTDSRLLEVAREKLVEVAKEVGITLKQTFAREGKELTRKASGYAHARQFRRLRKPINRQRTIVSRLARASERQMAALADELEQRVTEALSKAQRIVSQTKQRKSDGTPKLYSWPAPEVEVIAKGRAGAPYDGHTLAEQLEQASILSNATIKDVYVDLGYRGVDHQNPDVSITHRGKYKSLGEKERRLLKRRQAIEPIIGHLKSDHRMNRCHLRGSDADAIHAVLCAAGYNIRWLLRMILKKGVRLYFYLIRLLGLGGLFARKAPANPLDGPTSGRFSLLLA